MRHPDIPRASDASVRHFGARAQNVALDKAAQGHADFIAANLDAGRLDAYGHTENPKCPGFTGAEPADGASLHSYQGFGVGEHLAAEPSTFRVAQVLMSVTYHTVAALGIDREIGIGRSARTTNFAVPITVLSGLQSGAMAQYLDSRVIANCSFNRCVP